MYIHCTYRVCTSTDMVCTWYIHVCTFSCMTDMCIPNRKFTNMYMVHTCMYNWMYEYVYTWYRHGMYMFIQVYTHSAIYKHVQTMYRHVHTLFGRFTLVLCMYVIVCTGDIPATYQHRHFIKCTYFIDLCTYMDITCLFELFVLPGWLACR